MAISVSEVSKTFRPAPPWLRVLVRNPIAREISALRSVRLEVASGDVCALVGPNGAGKTTLFRILVGLTTPTSGYASVLGLNVVTDSLAIRRSVGWMPTSTETLFQRHSVAENLRFHGRIHGLSGPDLEKRIDSILELVELSHAKSNAVLALSAGMQARVRLARALIHEPDLLILDEPTSSVDPVASLSLINKILEIVRERAIAAVISSHRLDEIEALHSHVVLLHQGRVLFDGDLDTLRGSLEIPRYRIELSISGPADQYLEAVLSHASVTAASVESRDLVVSLAAGSALGPVLEAAGLDFDRIMSVQKIQRPLRDLLAEVYDVAPDRDDV